METSALSFELKGAQFDKLSLTASERGLVLRLYMLSPDNLILVHEHIKSCVEGGYDMNGFVAGMMEAAYFVLTVEEVIPSKVSVIAALVGYWLPFPDNAIETRFESVRKGMQRKGYGTLLFEALHATAAYLGRQDPFICMNLGVDKEVSVQVHADVKEDWHTQMLLKRGYEEMSCRHGERVMEKMISLV